MLDSLHGVYGHILVCRISDLDHYEPYKDDCLFKYRFTVVDDYKIDANVWVLCVQFIVLLAALVVSSSHDHDDQIIVLVQRALTDMHNKVRDAHGNIVGESYNSQTRTLYIFNEPKEDCGSDEYGLNQQTGKAEEATQTIIGKTNAYNKQSESTQIVDHVSVNAEIGETLPPTPSNVRKLWNDVKKIQERFIDPIAKKKLMTYDYTEIDPGTLDITNNRSVLPVIISDNVYNSIGKKIEGGGSESEHSDSYVNIKLLSKILRYAMRVISLIAHVIRPFIVYKDYDANAVINKISNTGKTCEQNRGSTCIQYNFKINIDTKIKNSFRLSNIKELWGKLDPGETGIDTKDVYNELWTRVSRLVRTINDDNMNALFLLARKDVQIQVQKDLLNKLNIRTFLRIWNGPVESSDFRSSDFDKLEIFDGQYVQATVSSSVYAFGPFTQIFGYDWTNETIADSINIAFSEDIQKGHNIIFAGYGLSGSGKTSTLVKHEEPFSPEHNYSANTSQGYGVFARIVENLFNTLAVSNASITELFVDNTQVKNKTHTSDMSNYARFIESIANANKARLTRATPNNPDSSRSHLLVTLDLTSGKKVMLIDFAGYEQQFECQDDFLNNKEIKGKYLDLIYTRLEDISNQVYQSLGNIISYIKYDKDFWTTFDITKLNSDEIIEFLESYDYSPEVLSKVEQATEVAPTVIERNILNKQLKDTCEEAAKQIFARTCLQGRIFDSGQNTNIMQYDTLPCAQFIVNITGAQTDVQMNVNKPIIEIKIGDHYTHKIPRLASGTYTHYGFSGDINLYYRNDIGVLQGWLSSYRTFLNTDSDHKQYDHKHYVITRYITPLCSFLYAHALTRLYTTGEYTSPSVPSNELRSLFHVVGETKRSCIPNITNFLMSYTIRRQNQPLTSLDKDVIIKETDKLTMFQRSLKRYAYLQFARFDSFLKEECEKRNEEGDYIRNTLKQLRDYFESSANPSNKKFAPIHPACIYPSFSPLVSSIVKTSSSPSYTSLGLPDPQNTKLYIVGVVALHGKEKRSVYVPIDQVRQKLELYLYDDDPVKNAAIEINSIISSINGATGRLKTLLDKVKYMPNETRQDINAVISTIDAYNSGTNVGVLKFMDNLTKLGYGTSSGICNITIGKEGDQNYSKIPIPKDTTVQRVNMSNFPNMPRSGGGLVNEYVTNLENIKIKELSTPLIKVTPDGTGNMIITHQINPDKAYTLTLPSSCDLDSSKMILARFFMNLAYYYDTRDDAQLEDMTSYTQTVLCSSDHLHLSSTLM